MSVSEFLRDRDEQAAKNGQSNYTRVAVNRFMDTIHATNYVKNFTWAGIPILQLPTDLMVMQEIIWKVKPDYIIETGVAFGGMTLFYASMLEAIGDLGEVYAIDIEIRNENRNALDRHPLRKRIRLFEGDSSSPNMLEKIKSCMRSDSKVLISFDSCHSHAHVLSELRLYAPLVSIGSYAVVMDTSIEFLDPQYIPKDRPWGKGNNPWTAVQEFMKGNDKFVVDTDIENRILLTSAPSGWLRRVK